MLDAIAALDRLAKWRAHFAGWQLGSRPITDPETQAIRDHREVTMIMRAELSALVGLLLAKGVFTAKEWTDQLAVEADALNAMYERKWPGVTATQQGLTYDLPKVKAAGWMAGWKP
jgi:hypothetical protein